MLITYCENCGARITIASGKQSDNDQCEDCLAGTPRRRGRNGDSAALRKRSTTTLLKNTGQPQ